MKKNIHKIVKPNESPVKAILKFARFAITRPGFNHIKKTFFNKAGVSNKEVSYSEWIQGQTNLYKLRNEYEKEIGTLDVKPKLSIIINTNALPVSLLHSSIKSISDQLYTKWELCISYPAATSGPITELLSMYRKDDRIRMISASEDIHPANAAFQTATGDYIILMELGDRLTVNCLFEFVKYINTHQSSELAYADEDMADGESKFSNPHFKPDWSPDNLLCRNYIGYPLLIKKDLAKQMNGFRTGFTGCEEYDLLLRATEISMPGHIPKVLYHKRILNNITQNNEHAKKALAEALIRRNTPGYVVPLPDIPGTFYINYEINKPGKVSIIIPTKDGSQLLKTAVDSIIDITDYPDYEIIVINNNSVSKEFFALIAEYEVKYKDRFRCINADFLFNFSKLINLGVSVSSGIYILMMNNDVEVIHGDWMTKMVSYAQHEQTGAVGAKLLFPDNTIQHAGIILGKGEATSHVFVNMEKYDNRYNFYVRSVNNYSAVTGACLMCRKELYHEVGGMDDQLPVEYNDVDLCLKMLEKGHYNVYLPTVELYHHESATRGHPFRSKEAWEQHNKDLTIFKNKWQKKIDADPFYNPNFKLNIGQVYI